MTNVNEIWLPIKGYEGVYEVSNFGRVKSLSKLVNKGKYLSLTKERILSQWKDGNDSVRYFRVELQHNKIARKYLVHRLVAEAFIPNPNNLQCINHIDSNSFNNNVDNLEWVTQKQNVHHAISKGRHSMPINRYRKLKHGKLPLEHSLIPSRS